MMNAPASCVSTGSWPKCVELAPAAALVLSMLKVIVSHCWFSEISSRNCTCTDVWFVWLASVQCSTVQWKAPLCLAKLHPKLSLSLESHFCKQTLNGNDIWKWCPRLFEALSLALLNSVVHKATLEAWNLNLTAKCLSFWNTSNSCPWRHCWKPHLATTCTDSIPCRL